MPIREVNVDRQTVSQESRVGDNSYLPEVQVNI